MPELEEWTVGAERLLVASAKAAGLSQPTEVLSNPRILIPPMDLLLSTVSLVELEGDEFWSLNAQLIALVAQILRVEHGGSWRYNARSDRFDIAVFTKPDKRVLDVTSVVRAVLRGDQPSATKAIALAESTLT